MPKVDADSAEQAKDISTILTAATQKTSRVKKAVANVLGENGNKGLYKLLKGAAGKAVMARAKISLGGNAKDPSCKLDAELLLREVEGFKACKFLSGQHAELETKLSKLRITTSTCSKVFFEDNSRLLDDIVLALISVGGRPTWLIDQTVIMTTIA